MVASQELLLVIAMKIMKQGPCLICDPLLAQSIPLVTGSLWKVGVAHHLVSISKTSAKSGEETHSSSPSNLQFSLLYTAPVQALHQGAGRQTAP